MSSFLRSETLRYAIICVVITTLISVFYFKGLMLDPTNSATTFGGDGLTIHYNLQYHATYGSGTHLAAQYYPHGETVFMTAAQGLLAVTLAALRPIFPQIGDHAVTISNILTYWSNIIAALFIFLCLVKLRVKSVLAVVFSVLISLLAPQIFRQTCGHYSLSFAFLIPAIVYYLLDNKFNKKFILKSILIVLLLVSLGLNDPYLLAIGSSLILGTTGVAFLFRTNKVNPKVIITWGIVAVISLLSTLFILSSLDTDADRTIIQYGFFDNISTIKGLLLGDHSWLSKILTPALGLRLTGSEAYNYVGIVPALCILFSLIILPTKKRIVFKEVFNDSNLSFILLGSFLVLLFSFTFPLSLFKAFTYDYLVKLLQFRAPGRFAWVFYYPICFMTVKLLSVYYDKLISHNKRVFAISSTIVILVVWAYDVHEFLHWRTVDKIHHNALSNNNLIQFKDLSEKHQLTQANYHGLFLLPSEHGWTDKVYHEGSWRSNYEGYRLSIASGLPLINGKLSRMSVSNNLAALQLVSDPLIKREILDVLDDKKSILILLAKGENLSPGEQAFADEGEEIYNHKNFSLLKVNLATLKTKLRANRKAAASTMDTLGLPIVYEHYEDQSPFSFAGNGCKKIELGKQEIISIPISDSYNNLELSLWNYVDLSRPGGPEFILQAMKEGQVIKEMRNMSLKAYDTQNGWLKLTFLIDIPRDATELKLSSKAKYHFYIDELLVRHGDRDNIYKDGQNLYYNNILIQD